MYLELLPEDEDDGEGWLTNVSLCFCFSFPSSLISGLFFLLYVILPLFASSSPALCVFCLSPVLRLVSVLFVLLFLLCLCLLVPLVSSLFSFVFCFFVCSFVPPFFLFPSVRLSLAFYKAIESK